MIDDLVVDDTTVYEVVDSREVSQTQNAINEITQWSEINKFQLHPKKCKKLRISFSRSSAIRELASINETAIIDLVKSVKVRGVIIQDNLKWNQHVDATVKKAAKRLYFLMRLKCAHVPAKDLVCFYIACIQSVLLYACHVFHYSLPKYLSSALERVQRRAMRIIYGYDVSYTEALKTANINSLSQSFFKQTISNPNNQLFHLLPFNTNHPSVTLRKPRVFATSLCKTNRFRNTLINASARIYDSK